MPGEQVAEFELEIENVGLTCDCRETTTLRRIRLGMKLVTWNCAMALPKKYQKLLTLIADTMVIQECSQSFTEQINRLGRMVFCLARLRKQHSQANLQHHIAVLLSRIMRVGNGTVLGLSENM